MAYEARSSKQGEPGRAQEDHPSKLGEHTSFLYLYNSAAFPIWRNLIFNSYNESYSYYLLDNYYCTEYRPRSISDQYSKDYNYYFPISPHSRTISFNPETSLSIRTIPLVDLSREGS